MSKYTNMGRRTWAFDAAGASGLAFLKGELALPHTQLVEPLEGTTYQYAIPIEIGGGDVVEYIEAWATNYNVANNGNYGISTDQATDIPMIQFNMNQAAYRALIYKMAMVVTFLDLDKLYSARSRGLTPPFSLDERLRKGIQLDYQKLLDRMCYVGWKNLPGLVNNPNVPASTLPATGTSGGVTWATKTSFEKFQDIQSLIATAVGNSGYAIGPSSLTGMESEGVPDTVLIPFSLSGDLAQPMGVVPTSGGTQPVGYNMSLKDYIEKFSVPTMLGLKFHVVLVPDSWIGSAGVGSTRRIVVYRNQKDAVLMKIPQPLTPRAIIPTFDQGAGYGSLYQACIGQVMWLRETTAAYGDGA